MELLAPMLVAAAILTAAFAVIRAREDKRSSLAAAIADKGTGNRRVTPKAVRRERVKAAMAARDGQDPLPWPFSRLNTLQRQAGEYDGPLRILLIIALSAAGLGVVSWILTGQALLTAAAVLSGVAVPGLLLRAKAKRRMGKIEDQVAGLCVDLEQAAQSGQPIEKALFEIAPKTPTPLGDELRLVVRDVSQGIPIDAALGEMAGRLPDAPSVRLFVGSVQISLEMGAPLGDQMSRIAEVIRARRLAHTRIAGVTATARTQAKALSFVPLAAYVWVHMSSPQTLAGYEGPIGELKLLGLAGWVVLGYFFTQKLLSDAFDSVL